MESFVKFCVTLTVVFWQATKVLFKSENGSAGNVVASGVEFVVDGKTYSVNATKEVIISAGAVQTPQLLELSGRFTLDSIYTY